MTDDSSEQNRHHTYLKPILKKSHWDHIDLAAAIHRHKNGQGRLIAMDPRDDGVVV